MRKEEEDIGSDVVVDVEGDDFCEVDDEGKRSGC